MNAKGIYVRPEKERKDVLEGSSLIFKIYHNRTQSLYSK